MCVASECTNMHNAQCAAKLRKRVSVNWVGGQSCRIIMGEGLCRVRSWSSENLPPPLISLSLCYCSGDLRCHTWNALTLKWLFVEGGVVVPGFSLALCSLLPVALISVKNIVLSCLDKHFWNDRLTLISLHSPINTLHIFPLSSSIAHYPLSLLYVLTNYGIVPALSVVCQGVKIRTLTTSY